MSRLRVKVQARASRTSVDGHMADGSVKIRLKAPPVGGAANEELVRFVSSILGVPGSAVRIVGGETSTRKTLQIDGLAESAVREALRGAQ